MEIWVIVLVQKPSHNILQTFRPLSMFKIVFRDSSFCPKQLSQFCLLWLFSASADHSGYVTDFCSMIELLHELKTAAFSIEAFRHFIMSQQGKRKTNFSGLQYTTKNCKFSCVLYAQSQFLCSRVADLAFLTPLACFGNKKSIKIWLFLAYFHSDRLGSGKTVSELHIHH